MPRHQLLQAVPDTALLVAKHWIDIACRQEYLVRTMRRTRGDIQIFANSFIGEVHAYSLVHNSPAQIY